MPETSVPFSALAGAVALSEDIRDLPRGQATSVIVLLSSLLTGDVVSSMLFVAKAHPSDADDNPLTITKTITPTLSADGVITATADDSVRRGVFALTRRNGVRIGNNPRYQYAVIASVIRDGETYQRVVQVGALRALLFSIEFLSPLADGTWYADGELFADGFRT